MKKIEEILRKRKKYYKKLINNCFTRIDVNLELMLTFLTASASVMKLILEYSRFHFYFMKVFLFYVLRKGSYLIRVNVS